MAYVTSSYAREVQPLSLPLHNERSNYWSGERHYSTRLRSQSPDLSNINENVQLVQSSRLGFYPNSPQNFKYIDENQDTERSYGYGTNRSPQQPFKIKVNLTEESPNSYSTNIYPSQLQLPTPSNFRVYSPMNPLKSSAGPPSWRRLDSSEYISESNIGFHKSMSDRISQKPRQKIFQRNQIKSTREIILVEENQGESDSSRQDLTFRTAEQEEIPFKSTRKEISEANLPYCQFILPKIQVERNWKGNNKLNVCRVMKAIKQEISALIVFNSNVNQKINIKDQGKLQEQMNGQITYQLGILSQIEEVLKEAHPQRIMQFQVEAEEDRGKLNDLLSKYAGKQDQQQEQPASEYSNELKEFLKYVLKKISDILTVEFRFETVRVPKDEDVLDSKARRGMIKKIEEEKKNLLKLRQDLQSGNVQGVIDKISASVEYFKTIPNEMEAVVAAIVKRDTHKASNVYYDVETKILQEMCQENITSINLEQFMLIKRAKLEVLQEIGRQYQLAAFADLKLPLKDHMKENRGELTFYIVKLQGLTSKLKNYKIETEQALQNKQGINTNGIIENALQSHIALIDAIAAKNQQNMRNLMIFKQKIEEIFQNFKKMHEKAGRVIENGQIAEEEVKEIMLISQDLEKAIESINLKEYDVMEGKMKDVISDFLSGENKAQKRTVNQLIVSQSQVNYSNEIVKGNNLKEEWDEMQEGKRKMTLDVLEPYYNNLKEMLSSLGKKLSDYQARSKMSQVNLNRANSIYKSLKAIHKQVYKQIFLNKEIQCIDIKKLLSLVANLDLEDEHGEQEFYKYFQVVHGIQAMAEIEEENQAIKAFNKHNQYFFKLIEALSKQHKAFKAIFSSSNSIAKLPESCSQESFILHVTSIIQEERSLLKQNSQVVHQALDYFNRCKEQTQRKWGLKNAKDKNKYIEELSKHKEVLFEKIEAFYYKTFELNAIVNVGGSIDSVYSSNGLDFPKFAEQIKNLMKKFKNQNQQDNYNIVENLQVEVAHNQILTNYIIQLNNFLLKTANQLSSSLASSSLGQASLNKGDAISQAVAQLAAFNEEKKIEISLKKRKNINFEIYSRFVARSQPFLKFFEFAAETRKLCISSVLCFEKHKKEIDLGDADFRSNLEGVVALKGSFEARLSSSIIEMKETKLFSYVSFAQAIGNQLNSTVKELMKQIDISFLAKLKSLLDKEGYLDCSVNYITAYSQVNQYISVNIKKKQLKDFIDDLHSLFLPSVSSSLSNSLTNWRKYQAFIPEVKASKQFESLRYIPEIFELHKHKNCEDFFNSLYAVLHNYVESKRNPLESKDLLARLSANFQNHNQVFQVNIQRQLSAQFQSFLTDDYTLYRNFKI